MKTDVLALLAVVVACSASQARSPAPSDVACLPARLRATDIVSAERVGSDSRLVTVTVAQRL